MSQHVREPESSLTGGYSWHAHFKLLLHDRTKGDRALRVLHRLKQALHRQQSPNTNQPALLVDVIAWKQTHRPEEEVERGRPRGRVRDEYLAFFLSESLRTVMSTVVNHIFQQVLEFSSYMIVDHVHA